MATDSFSKQIQTHRLPAYISRSNPGASPYLSPFYLASLHHEHPLPGRPAAHVRLERLTQPPADVQYTRALKGNVRAVRAYYFMPPHGCRISPKSQNRALHLFVLEIFCSFSSG